MAIYLLSNSINDFVRKIWKVNPELNVGTLSRDFHRFKNKTFKLPSMRIKKEIEYNLNMFSTLDKVHIKDLISYNNKHKKRTNRKDILKYVTKDNLVIDEFFKKNVI